MAYSHPPSVKSRAHDAPGPKMKKAPPGGDQDMPLPWEGD